MKKTIIALLAAFFCTAAAAQSYPERQVRIVVPYTPGGANDVVGRVFATELGQQLGGTVIVENKPGASGAIGAEYVAKSPADGYTLLLGANAVLVVNPFVSRSLGYTPKDFVPVGIAAEAPMVAVVNNDLPVRSLKELVDYARKSKGGLNFASPGRGTQMHLVGEIFKAQERLDIAHVPYKGSAPALVDVVAGRVQLMFDSVQSALPQIRDGRLRALAVTGARRLDSLPEVPTVSEAGMPSLGAVSWFSIMAPAATPKPVLSRLRQAMAAASKSPAVQKPLAALGAQPSTVPPEQADAFIENERARWTGIIRQANLKFD